MGREPRLEHVRAEDGDGEEVPSPMAAPPTQLGSAIWLVKLNVAEAIAQLQTIFTAMTVGTRTRSARLSGEPEGKCILRE